MEVLVGKKEDKLLKEVLKKLNANIDEIKYSITEEGKNKKIIALTLDELKIDIKNFLTDIIRNLDLTGNVELNIDDNRISIEIDSNNNAILIGKNGKNLISLENLVKSFILIKYNLHFNIDIDIEEYKVKKEKRFINSIKKICREVRYSNVDVVLDDMNSYERRKVHNIASEMKGVKTISEGEEPHRHVIIKPSK